VKPSKDTITNKTRPAGSFSVFSLCSDLLADWPVNLVMGQERDEAEQVNPRGESVSRDNLTQAQAQVNPHRTGVRITEKVNLKFSKISISHFVPSKGQPWTF
jgi:hypothetical protein